MIPDGMIPEKKAGKTPETVDRGFQGPGRLLALAPRLAPHFYYFSNSLKIIFWSYLSVLKRAGDEK